MSTSEVDLHIQRHVQFLAETQASRVAAPDGYTIADQWEEAVASHAKRSCLVFIGDTAGKVSMTYEDVDRLANQVAHWALSRGLRRGDTVALFMGNHPRFVAMWLGLAKIGVVTAWINNTIKAQPLVHSIRIVSARMLAFSIDLADVVSDVHADLREGGMECVCSGGNVLFCSSSDAEVDSQSGEQPPRSLRVGTRYQDTMCYIYTSGTTGLPKAAKIWHLNYCQSGLGARLYMSAEDVIYGSGMPLYHSAAGMLGIGWMIGTGASYVIRPKFSAGDWLRDVCTCGATVAQHIGELCRYVLSTPAQEGDAQNPLRFCIGNGLRPEYWDKFQLRFAVDNIIEFYGATEGAAGFQNLIKLESLRKGDYTGYGSVGKLLDPSVVFLKYDIEQDELVRDSAGFCIRTAVDEPGEMLVKLDPAHEFRGYSDEAASKKKLLSDVLERGDLYMRMGDLMRVDADGWIYFVDRIGDTFRWKGENVSTAEVASELSKFPGVEEVNVYGVLIPNNEDGRAGMCAMIMEDVSESNLDVFYKHATSRLPPYAVPLFLRILPAMEITGTFKHQKVQLRNDGIDLAKVSDPIYYLDHGKYGRVDAAAYERITTGPAARAKL